MRVGVPNPYTLHIKGAIHSFFRCRVEGHTLNQAGEGPRPRGLRGLRQARPPGRQRADGAWTDKAEGA